MPKRKLPAGFTVPAQPVERDKPPSGADWVHEIKHDGYRLLVHRDGADVRLLTRNGSNLAGRFPAIVAAALKLKAERFIIDGEAVVLGPDGLAQFDELRRREGGRRAILYAFDLLWREGENLRPLAFLARK